MTIGRIDLSSSRQIILAIQAVIFTHGCSSSERDAVINIQQTVSFQTEWPWMQRYSGTLLDDSTGREFIFSGDPHTHQLIRVFNPAGGVLKDVPLSTVLDSLGELDSFTMISPDRFFAQQVHGPRVAVFASDGQVVQTWSLKDALCDKYGDRYALSGASNGPSYHKGTVYMETDWIGACVSPQDSRHKSLEAAHRDYFRDATRKCKVAAIKIEDQSAVKFGACDILVHLSDTPRCTIGGVLRIFTQGRLFAISAYCPEVLELDDDELFVTARYPLSFSGGVPAIYPPPISSEDIRMQGYNSRLIREPKITAFKYDARSDKFLAIVYHKSEKENELEVDYTARAFSILVLDGNMHVISESQFDQGKYSANVLLTFSDSSWILAASHGPKNVRKPKVFHHIQVSA